MQEADFQGVKAKIVNGVFALVGQTFLLQIISFVSTFILTVLLSPATFGVFFIVSAIISFLGYFSDVGLAAALVQKKGEPTQEELTSVFTLQQLLIGTLVVLALFFAPTLSSFYGFSSDGIFLFRALAIAFFLSSLKTIPSILLERKLEFSRLIIPQILETFSFYVVAIILAFSGMEIVSFAWAALVRGGVGLIAIYILSPWSISFGLSRSVLRELISFGLPFQANSLLALVKDDLVTLVLGKILPIAHIGYLGWAKKWAEVPLRLIMDSIMKVTFPAFARLQQNHDLLRRALEKTFLFLSLFIFPATMVLIFFIDPIVSHIPRYEKWLPALPAFYFFAVASLFASFSSPVVNALNAIGKIRVTLLLMICWTVLTWTLIPMFALSGGFQLVAFGYFLIACTGVAPLLLMKRYISFSILSKIVKPAVASLTIAGASIGMRYISSELPVVVIIILISLLFYAGICWISFKEEIIPYLPKKFFPA